ncbi:MAG TPA: DUF3048 domain-containing protein [Pseudonocardiaceae bacterium]|nr:DUF3048 domain-containing protein [Pseudonocardiaceae bacterium]
MSRRGQLSRVLALLLVVYALPVTLLSQSGDASLTSSGTALSGSLGGPAASRLGSGLSRLVPSSVMPSSPLGAPLAELPSPRPAAPVSPFTGLPADLAAPVLCVKIDNASVARPQSGLELADLVYVEPVEGGLSRLLAVFQSRVPPVVGPVRSARASDVELLANFGRQALAYSGAAPSVGALVAAAPVADVSELARPGAYHRDRRRRMPHNLYGDPGQLRQGGAPPRDIGFRFGPAPAGGNPVGEAGVSYPATRIGVRWDAGERRWLISMDGAPLTSATGARPGAATVVLQRVSVRDAGVRDAAGSPSPFAATVGSGDAVVLRDGLAFAGRWSRPSAEAITTFTLSDGSPLTFAPGPVWVLLVPA